MEVTGTKCPGLLRPPLFPRCQRFAARPSLHTVANAELSNLVNQYCDTYLATAADALSILRPDSLQIRSQTSLSLSPLLVKHSVLNSEQCTKTEPSLGTGAVAGL